MTASVLAAPAPGTPRVGRRRHARRRVVPAIVAVTAGNGATLLLGLASGVLTARVLGPVARGEFLATQTLAAIVAVVLTLGAAQAVVTDRGDDAALRGPLVAQIGVALVGGAVFFWLLAVTGRQSWLGVAGLAGAAAATVSGVAVALCAGMAQRHSRMTVDFQAVRILPPLAGLLLLVVPWSLGHGTSAPWILASGVGAMVPALILLGRSLGGPRALAAVRTVRPAPTLVKGSASAFGTVVGAQVVYRLDAVLVALLLAPVLVAFYGIAATVGQACATVGQSFGMLAFSRLRTVREPAARRALVRRGTAGAVAVAVLVAVPIAAAAPELIRLVYGPAFAPAAAATRVLTLAAIPLSADYLLIHALLSLSAQGDVYRTQIVVGTLTAVALAVVIPMRNLAGIAAVSVGAYTLSAALLYLAVLRRTAVGRPA